MIKLNTTVWIGVFTLLSISAIAFLTHLSPIWSVLPQPTKGTVIRSSEDEGNYDERMKWIDAVHGGPLSNWRSIEAANRWLAYQQNLENPAIQLRNGDEWVADNHVLGKWIERGSNNNSGSIMTIDYDPIDDMFYAMGAGGCIFKGDPSGYFWEVVNDKLRFSDNLLKITRLDDGKKRMVAAIEGYPHYSDDLGRTWKAATGVVPTTDGWSLYNSDITKDGTIVILARKSWTNPVRCYASFDNGVSYKTLKIFTGSNTNDYAFSYDKISDKGYIIENVNKKITTYRLNEANKNLEVLNKSIDFDFGDEAKVNLAATTIKDTTNLFVYTKNGEIHLSKDLGLNWTKQGNIPTSPWSVGMYISPSDPRKQFYGEVDSYRSLNWGKNWIKMSSWGDYYADPLNKLHADIMYMKEFTKANGDHFLVNCNHGGIYTSIDYGQSWQSIGILGLNVSQYYDVRTYPSDPYFIFAGSQDQGQQRGRLRDEESAELFQNISGDYGHIEFTGNGKSLWSVYPGGSIGFYSNPLTQNYPIKGYEIDSRNETVWISPIMPSSNPNENVVIAAGGSTDNNSSGSYLLRLEYKNNEINATQLPYNFASSGGQISAMAIDPQNSNIWYVATTNGAFFRSNDAGISFTRKGLNMAGAHYLYGSCVFPSSVHTNRVYLTGNGYSNKPVYVSNNDGDNWQEMSTGLPPTTVFNIDANEDESLIFAATEAGPYVFIAAKGRWYPLSGSLTPSQTYWSVEYVEDTKTARFGTYGRGIWDFVVKEISTATSETTNVNSLSVYPNPAIDQLNIKSSTFTGLVTIEISNSVGQRVALLTQDVSQPINVFQLKSGHYFVNIRQKGKQFGTRFIKI
jgi:photosystem II stability/assembly factor-like uncharacterized protein